MNRALAGALVVLGVAGAVFFQHLPSPFANTIHGYNSSWYAIVARNFERLGFFDLRLALCLDLGVPSAPHQLYFNHPPLFGWLCGVVAKGCGSGEWQARVVPAVLSTLAALMGFLLLRRALGGAGWAALGAVLAALSPVWTHYGNMADPQGSGVLLGLFASCWLLLRWEENRSAGRLRALLLALAWTTLCDWPGFVFGGLVALWLWRRDRRAAAWTAGVPVLLAGLLVLHRTWAGGGAAAGGIDVFATLGLRTGLSGLVDHRGEPVPWSQCLVQIADHHLSGAFLPITVAGILALLVERRFALWAPALVGLCHVVLFPQGAYVHDFWQLYLIAGLALPATALLRRLALCSRWVWPAALALAVASSLVAIPASEARWREGAALAERTKAAALTLSRATAPRLWVGSTLPEHKPFEFYADRRCVWNLRDPEQLLRAWRDLAPYAGGFLLRQEEHQTWSRLLEHAGMRELLAFDGLVLYAAR